MSRMTIVKLFFRCFGFKFWICRLRFKTKIHGLDRFHWNGPYCKILTEKEPMRAQGFAEDWVCRIIKHLKSGFQIGVEKPKPKQLLPPITTGANSAMNQSEFLAVTCNLLKARENITRTWCDWFWMCFSLVEKLGEIFSPMTWLLFTVIWKQLYITLIELHCG